MSILPRSGFLSCLTLTCLLIASPVFSQSINVDFGGKEGTPSGGFGGAAKRVGVWNAVPTGAMTPLVDRKGAATTATITVGGGTRLLLNNPATFGDSEALLDDLFDLGAVGTGPMTITIDGLRAGDYTVYTYSWAPENPGYRTRVGVAGSAKGTVSVGGSWPGRTASRVTHAEHPVTIGDGESLTIDLESAVGFGSLNGLQVVLGLPADDPEFRTVDGSGNNIDNPEWGMAGTPLLRLTTISYDDGISAPSGEDRPGAREISNAVADQAASIPNTQGISDFFWQWGQFLDHDIDLTPEAVPHEAFDIPVPTGDPFFDPLSTGDQVIGLNRSVFDPASGTAPETPRAQLNLITSFIDASNVYGSDAKRQRSLRSNDGTGRLRVSQGDLLPFNYFGLGNAGGSSKRFFLAGDVRSNEQLGLTAMHTLFMREHNRLAREIADEDATLTGDQIYQRARSIVGALMQVITFNEFIPILLGEDALAPYGGYDPVVNSGISNIFSAAVYRLGHTLLSPNLQRLEENGDTIPEGALPLRDAFFSPERIIEEGGIEPLLRGLAAQSQQELDAQLVDDVRNFLFGPPGAGGFDLGSLNIQRGRDHGLPGFNQVRVDFGLEPYTSLAEISSDPAVVARLSSIYAGVDGIDPWIGLAEDEMAGALVGETFFTVLQGEFERLRDGDRFWFELVFAGDELEELRNTTLADVIRRNTTIGSEIPDDVFRVDDSGGTSSNVLRGVHFRR